MTTDTTNALRALADRVLGLTVVGEVCGTERNAIAAELRALATAQGTEAKPEGVDDLRDAAVSLLLGARPYSDVTSIVPNARLKTLAQAARLTRQAQGGESKPKLRSGFVSPLQDSQTKPELRQAQGGGEADHA